jgi:hypothetical protein
MYVFGTAPSLPLFLLEPSQVSVAWAALLLYTQEIPCSNLSSGTGTSSHSVTHTHKLGLLWTRDRPVTETSTCTRHYIHYPSTQWDSNPQSHRTSGRRLTVQRAWVLGSASSVRNRTNNCSVPVDWLSPHVLRDVTLLVRHACLYSPKFFVILSTNMLVCAVITTM